jgi:hypothetical protein
VNLKELYMKKPTLPNQMTNTPQHKIERDFINLKNSLTAIEDLLHWQKDGLLEKISKIEKAIDKKISGSLDLEKKASVLFEKHLETSSLRSKPPSLEPILPFLKQTEINLRNIHADILRVDAHLKKTEKPQNELGRKALLFIFFTPILTGALISVCLILLHTPPLSLFLVNERAREAYATGCRVLEYKEKLRAQSASHPSKETSNQKKGSKRK